MLDFHSFKHTPKAELHVHLEGAMQVQTVVDWVKQDANHPWHGEDASRLSQQFKMANFQEFIKAFMTGYKLLDSQQRYQQITEDLCSQLESQGVTYAEVLYSPGVQLQYYKRPLQPIHQGIAMGLRQFPNLHVRFILDTVLNLGFEFMQTTLNEVLAQRPAFLAGFSVGGGDPALKMDPFLPLFEKAQRAGLFCVAHAGEVDGPDNIRSLVENTDLLRIAHGCAAVEDSGVLELLKKRQITIDVCLTSNQKTGASADYELPPAETFLKHQIPITLNTDDPLYFCCDLFGEYNRAARELELSWDRLKRIMAHSLSFQPATP